MSEVKAWFGVVIILGVLGIVGMGVSQLSHGISLQETIVCTDWADNAIELLVCRDDPDMREVLEELLTR